MPPSTSRFLRNDYSRMWLQEFGAGPGNAPEYEGQWKAGGPTFKFGDITAIYEPSNDEYGRFNVAGKIQGQPGLPTMNVMARYLADQASTLLRLGRQGCSHDLQVHIGMCEDPQDFDRGWEKILIITEAYVTQFATDDLGAMEPGERKFTLETVPVTGIDLYEILRIVFAEEASAQVVQAVVGIIICDRIICGSCGIPSTGCDKIFAVTKSHGGSPGLPAEVVYSGDGGVTWEDTSITTIGATEDPSGLACVGLNLVVISNESDSLHYAALADILLGTETWAEVTTGFVMAKGPNAIWSAGPHATFIVGNGGYVYWTADPTAGVSVLNAGIATVQNLVAVHGIDQEHVVAVGASNAVIATIDGVTWQTITGPNVGVALTSVWMHTQTEWFVGDATGKLWYTQDSGDSWTEKTFPGSGAGTVQDIKFASPAVGYMSHTTAAPAGRILRTVDGGYSWYVAPEGNTVITANDQITALAVCEENVNLVYGGGLGDGGVDGIIVKGAS